MKVNWKIRFHKENIQFYIRFFASLIIPILAYLGYEYGDLTSWGMVWDIIVKFFQNPVLIGLTIVNALNLIPDPTTKGLSDSRQALRYIKPRDDKEYL